MGHLHKELESVGIGETRRKLMGLRRKAGPFHRLQLLKSLEKLLGGYAVGVVLGGPEDFEAEREIDAEGLIVCPGLIDLSVRNCRISDSMVFASKSSMRTISPTTSAIVFRSWAPMGSSVSAWCF